MTRALVLCVLVACSRNETLDEAVLVPGESLGPVHLGATRAEVNRTGLTVRIDPSAQGGDQVSFVGPFTVIFDAVGRAESVAIDLNKLHRGLHVGTELLGPKDGIVAALRILGPCDPGMPYDGGTAYRCHHGQSRIEQSSNEHAPLRIRVLR